MSFRCEFDTKFAKSTPVIVSNVKVALWAYYLKPLNNIVFTALHKCLYPLHIHCTENLKFVTLRFSWRQINSWSQPNWQLTNEKWSFFVLALSFVLCFALLLGMCELQAPESRLIAELLDDKNWIGKWPKTSIIANFSVPKSCVFIFGSLCCSLSPKTRVSDFQFFPDSEEEKKWQKKKWQL